MNQSKAKLLGKSFHLFPSQHSALIRSYGFRDSKLVYDLHLDKPDHIDLGYIDFNPFTEIISGHFVVAPRDMRNCYLGKFVEVENEPTLRLQ